jgi:Protein of Unknown function (DUF2784)
MWYGLLADGVVAIHVAYVSYVVFGQLAIFAGIVFRWQWIRNVWFRVTHLVMMSIVAVEALLNIKCPLTVWEDKLRVLAGQPPSGETFIGRLLHNLLFYTWPQWVFTTLYVSFALLVMATFIMAPPRRVRRS